MRFSDNDMIVLAVIFYLSSVVMILYLLKTIMLMYRKAIPNKLFQRSITLLCLSHITFICLSVFVSLQKTPTTELVVIQRVAMSLVLYFNLLQNVQIFKMFSVLSSFWTVERIRVCQYISMVLFLPSNGGLFLEPIWPRSIFILWWMRIGLVIWITSTAACNSFISYHISYLVRKDSVKVRGNFRQLDLAKFNSFYDNFQRNLLWITLLNWSSLLSVIVIKLLPWVNPIYSESVVRLGIVPLALQPIFYTYLFASMLQMQFSANLRIRDLSNGHVQHFKSSLKINSLKVLKTENN
ncbi:hypothetical protein BC833DRAFT_594949 [Globomyces pollinis-pini]|nr:hypothetical protein BC833DRAFT_594949 [Globomyces pollinis-pini]